MTMALVLEANKSWSKVNQWFDWVEFSRIEHKFVDHILYGKCFLWVVIGRDAERLNVCSEHRDVVNASERQCPLCHCNPILKCNVNTEWALSDHIIEIR